MNYESPDCNNNSDVTASDNVNVKGAEECTATICCPEAEKEPVAEHHGGCEDIKISLELMHGLPFSGDAIPYFKNGYYAKRKERRSSSGSNYTCAPDSILAVLESTILSPSGEMFLSQPSQAKLSKSLAGLGHYSSQK